MLASFLFEIEDHRRAEGKRYQLGHILLFSIFAVLSGADSYRKVHKFIVNHYPTLNERFKLNWKRMPAYTTIRDIIKGVSPSSIEAAFRKYSAFLTEDDTEKHCVAFDGKVLRGSFDHFHDKKAVQILSAFLTDTKIILAHQEIEAKTNEIPTAQALMSELGLENCIFTFDAINCQKKH